MCRCEIPFGVSEGSITTFLLVQFTPIFVRWSGKREIDIARHVPLVFVLVDQFGNEFRRKSNQKSLKKKERKRKLHTGLKTNFSFKNVLVTWLTLVMTANWANISKILNQMPIFSARSATALRVSQTNFWASRRISTQLLSSAKKGARGKAATKMVMKPNCNTATRKNRIKYAWNALFNNLEKIMSLIKKWIKGEMSLRQVLRWKEFSQWLKIFKFSNTVTWFAISLFCQLSKF